MLASEPRVKGQNTNENPASLVASLTRIRVAALLWNGWQPSPGMCGSFGVESVAALLWNTQVVSLGDHLLATRLNRGLVQKEVAAALEISIETLSSWENNQHYPSLHQQPKIVCFLGYDLGNQFVSESSLGDQLRQIRTEMGQSQRVAADLIGIDPRTLGRYELDLRKPPKRLLSMIERYIVEHS